MRHKLSAYGYLFNGRKFDFSIEETVANFCSFFNEVVCATVPSEDDTREVLAELEKKHPNFRVIDSNIKILGNPLFDGQLKTLAMNECRNELRVIMDFDEVVCLSNADKWDKYCDYLLSSKHVEGILIPVIDCVGSKEKIRSDTPIGQKFRLHKSSVHARGVPNFAKRSDGYIDTSRSDTTDVINANGDLCQFQSIVPQMFMSPMFADMLVDFPYVLHFGSVSLERRAKIGKEFWAQAWSERSGREENVITSVNQFENIPLIYHNLPLE